MYSDSIRDRNSFAAIPGRFLPQGNSSVVLRLQYGDHSFLFMGDAEGKDRGDPANVAQYVEQILIQNHLSQLDVTVLKVGHHGSQTSRTDPFIDAVDPDIVIVQSGRRNFNGTFIPDAATLQRFCDHNPAIRIYRTDQNDEADGLSASQAADGDHIVIRTNGSGTPTVTALEGGPAVSGNYLLSPIELRVYCGRSSFETPSEN